ncbi:ligand-binding sensor domain-containing protein [Desulfofundulus luciae]|nr:hypothetical protein [Desulfofundulus luciae]
MRFAKITFLMIITIISLLTFSTGASAGSWVDMGYVPGKITIAPDGTIWSAGGSGTLGRVKYWNGSGWKDIPAPTLSYQGDPTDGSSYDEFITGIAVRSDGTLFICTDGNYSGASGGRVLKYVNGNWVSDSPASEAYRDIAADHNGNIWVQSYKYRGYYNIHKLSGSGWVLESSTIDTFFSADFTILDDRVVTAKRYYGSYVYQRYYSSSSWEGMGSSTSNIINAVSKTIDGKVIIGCSDGHVYYWNGYSWVDMGIPAPGGYAVYSLANAPDGSILAGTDKGFVSRYNGSSWDVLGQVCNYRIIKQIILGDNGDIIVRSDTNQVMRYSSDLFSLVPSPNGPTGKLVIDSRYLGFAPVHLKLQQSTDGVNFSDCFTVSNGSKYIFTPTKTSYYFRFKWYWPYITSGHKTNYSNVVGPVQAIVGSPTLNISSTGIAAWDAVRGRSKVVLSWSPLTNATNYRLYIFDGNQYRSKDLGNVNSWDSSIAKVFPYPGDLPENNSISADIFRWDGSGLDLEDDPRRLYRSTQGTSYDNSTNYWFRIVATNQWMETDLWATSAVKTPTLPNATDTEKPAGSVSVVSREGLEKTYDTRIKIIVNASDGLSGVRRVELSNDGVSYTQKYEAPLNPDNGTGVANYSSTFDWDLPLGAGTKVVYVRITDAVGNQKVVTDTIALAEDMLPPSISLLINDGATSTTTKDVTLTISASDNASTASQMQMAFSNNGSLWSPWEPYQQTKTWDITNSSYGGTSGAGVKKVYVRIYDQAQNIGLASAEIAYNPNPPVASGVTFTGGVSGTYSGQPAIFVKGDMPILNVTATGAAKMRYDNGIGVWSDWEPYVSSKQIVLAKSSGVCRVRVQVADSYGVASEPVETLVVVDNKAPTIIKVSGQNGTTATSTGTFYVMVQATDDMPGQLQACASVDGGAFGSWYNVPQSAIPVTLSTTGAHSITVKVKDLAGNESQANMTAFKVAA